MMSNAKLIKVLRCKASNINDCTMCGYHNACYDGTLENIAADVLEADDIKVTDYMATIDALDDSNDAYIKANERLKKRIAELERQHGEQLTRNVMLVAQLPKEGEWKCSYPEIESNPMLMYGICSICGFEQSISNKLNYCPNCGARMRKGE